jgi:hypothetical protein
MTAGAAVSRITEHPTYRRPKMTVGCPEQLPKAQHLGIIYELFIRALRPAVSKRGEAGTSLG